MFSNLEIQEVVIKFFIDILIIKNSASRPLSIIIDRSTIFPNILPFGTNEIINVIIIVGLITWLWI